jgi:LacI family transcriptional regulator
MAGYRWALQQYGLQYTADLVCTDLRRLLGWPPREPDKEQHNERVLRAFLTRRNAPDAIFVCNDYVAFQVVQVAEGLGLQIPRDLALVGFDNVTYRDYFGVPLTTIDQHRHAVGATAARLLLDRMTGRRTHVGRVVISTRLIVRRSSMPTSSNHTQEEASSANASVRSTV